MALTGGGLVAVVVVACVLAAVLFAFKDKIPLLKHLPEIGFGWCCCFGCYRPDYMEDDRRPRPNQELPTTNAETVPPDHPPLPEAQVVSTKA